MHYLKPYEATIVWREVLYCLAVAWFVVSLVNRPTGTSAIIGSSPLRYIGKFSYGIYLVHILCINAVERIVASPVRLSSRPRSYLLRLRLFCT
jgi:peptidoglycan/LPS O-acetylase OafA/YrhL